jgi:RNA polymerase sigma-70 factor, ECF subfamily
MNILPSDDELMRGIAQRDEAAFETLLRRWEGPVFAFLRQMLGDAEEARDLTQDTFVKVYGQAKRYQGSGKFRSWLFRIAGNLARSQLRRRQIVRWVPFITSHHDRASRNSETGGSLERQEDIERVRRALENLPARQRQAIILRRYESMSYKEIAESLDSTVAAVQALLNRAMNSLRGELLVTDTDRQLLDQKGGDDR